MSKHKHGGAEGEGCSVPLLIHQFLVDERAMQTVGALYYFIKAPVTCVISGSAVKYVGSLKNCVHLTSLRSPNDKGQAETSQMFILSSVSPVWRLSDGCYAHLTKITMNGKPCLDRNSCVGKGPCVCLHLKGQPRVMC